MSDNNFLRLITDMADTEVENNHHDDLRQTQISPTPQQIGSFLPDINKKKLSKHYNVSVADSPDLKVLGIDTQGSGSSGSVKSGSVRSWKVSPKQISAIPKGSYRKRSKSLQPLKELIQIPARITPSGNLVSTSRSGTLVKYRKSTERIETIAKAEKNKVEFNFGIPYGLPIADNTAVYYAPPYSVSPLDIDPSYNVSERAKQDFYRYSEQAGPEQNISNWRPAFNREFVDSSSPRGQGQGRIIVRAGSPPQSYFERLQKSKFSANQGRGRGRRRLPCLTGWDIAKPLGPHSCKHLPSEQELIPMIKDYINKFALQKTIDIPRPQKKPGEPDNCVPIYMAKHGIEDFFQMMITSLLVRRPDDPLGYLIEFTGILARALRNSNSVGDTKKQPPCFWKDSLKELDSLMFRTAANASAASYLKCNCPAESIDD